MKSRKRLAIFAVWLFVAAAFLGAFGAQPSAVVMSAGEGTIPSPALDLPGIMAGDVNKTVFVADYTPSTATTGEQLNFSVNVTDDVAVYGVWVEYWYGTGSHTNSTMTQGTGDIWYHIITVADTLDTLHYMFHANDTSDNWNETSMKNITITDNDRPVFGTDGTPSSRTTGEQLTFSINVTDNVGVNTVTVEYWYGTGTHTNVTMTNVGGNQWDYTITVADTLDTLYYIFHANDTSDNWNETSTGSVSISDNDRPVFGTDGTPSSRMTGEQLTFSINVTDNIGVSTVTVEYWYGTGSHTNVTMTNVGGNQWDYTITVANTPDPLYYIFHANDTSDNWNETSTVRVAINPPVFGTDGTPSSGTTGERLTFSINVTDNVGVNTVTVEYWYGTGSHTNVTMTNVGGNQWDYTITVADTLDTLYYIFHANDTSGNWVATAQKSITVIDNDRPVFGTDGTPTVGYTGDSFTFSIVVTDNVGVSAVYVEYWYGTGAHTNLSLSRGGGNTWTRTITVADTLDTLYYLFSATDASSNWNITSTKAVPIYDNDPPEFTDHTFSVGYTGDPFLFNVTVTDNIALQSANPVWLYYWFGDNESRGTNVSMQNAGGDLYQYQITIPLNSLDLLHYYFMAVDTSGNWGRASKTVVIKDNDLPEILADYTPSVATTGDFFQFRVNVTDNIGIGRVAVYYQYGPTGTPIVVEMEPMGMGIYVSNITVEHTLTPIEYNITVWDTSLNSVTSLNRTVIILDNDLPTFVLDATSKRPTTGEEFVFLVGVADNIEISSVFIEYWFGGGTHTNISMVPLEMGVYSYAIIIPHQLGTLHYIIHISDTSDHWNQTEERVLTIIDNDLPELVSMTVPEYLTTGEDFTISLDAADNIGLGTVTLYYKYGEEEYTSVTLSGSAGHYTYTSTAPSDSTDSFFFYVVINDTSGNSISTPLKVLSVIDNDMPVLEVLSGEETWAGTYFVIAFTVTDNVGLSTVSVEYSWGGSEFSWETYEFEDLSGGLYELNLTVPEEYVGNLYYAIHVEDTSGNSIITDQYRVIVKDGISPVATITVVEEELLENVPFHLSAEGSYDNWGIENYTWHITGEGTDVYYYGAQVEITLPHYGTYEVELKVSDGSGNTATTTLDITVIDNTPPVAWIGETPERIGLGTTLQLDGSASSDNVEIVEYTWVVHTPSGDVILAGMSVEIELLEIGEYSVELVVRDGRGLTATDTASFSVYDTIPPQIGAQEDIYIMLGEYAVLRDNGSVDNVGIVEYTWKIDVDGTIVTLTGHVVTYLFGDPGNYTVTEIVKDAEGQSNETTFIIHVMVPDPESDDDEDGLPYGWEIRYGLNPEVDDGNLDYDHDGLSNREEYMKGTDPTNIDTDGDGMPDGWEVSNGLNPLDSSDAQSDTDEDDIPAIDEFRRGTSPQVSDKVEKEKDYTPVIVGVLLIILILLLLVWIYIERSGRRLRHIDEKLQNLEREIERGPAEEEKETPEVPGAVEGEVEETKEAEEAGVEGAGEEGVEEEEKKPSPEEEIEETEKIPEEKGEGEKGEEEEKE